LSAYNRIGTGGSGGLVNGVNGNQVDVANPGLDPNGLRNNGGPTQTIAVLPGSPAIGAGSDTIPCVTVPTTDQRGVPRPSNSIDIGAFQDRGFPLTIVRGSSPQRTTVNTEFSNPPAVIVTSKYGDPVAGGVLSVSVIPNQNGALATLSAVDATIAVDGQASVTATANGIQGKYSVTASATGVQRPASFLLANVDARDGATAIALGASTPSAAKQAAGYAPITVPLPSGTAGPRSQRAGRARPALSQRPAPRAEVRLVGGGRSRSLGAAKTAESVLPQERNHFDRLPGVVSYLDV
jgi:hypothetical protein